MQELLYKEVAGIKLIYSSIKKDYPDFYQLAYCLTTEEKKRIQTYAFSEDSMRFGLARYLLRIELSKILNKPPSQVYLSYTKYGKPYLEGYKGIYFSISHSEEYVLIALSSSRMGVDIECIKNIDDTMINSQFFTKEEIRKILYEDKTNKIKTFYSIWTQKEAFIKAIGVGMYIEPSTFDMLNEKMISFEGKKYKIENILDIPKGYVGGISYHI